MKIRFRFLLNIFFVCVLFYSLFNVGTRLYDYKRSEDLYSSLRVVDDGVSDNPFDVDAFTEKNSDYRFWLKVDDTFIDYPVVQGEDNYFYLHHDFYKQQSKSGSIFLDYEADESSKNLIVYGHNMKNRFMFSSVNKFKDKEFFDDNNKVRVFIDDKEFVYEVFSVYVLNADDEFIPKSFSSDEQYSDYLQGLLNKSIYKTDITVGSDDNIITLYTCSYEDDNTRTIVHAKLIS